MIGEQYSTYIESAPTEAQRHFDVIVIGSGVGGLCTASCLARAGKRVLLLEQHIVLGGFTHSFQRSGYSWDVGLHYVGQVHIKGSTLNKVFRYITKDKLQWEPLDNVYDRAVFDKEEFEFPRGRANLRAKLKVYFPESKDCVSIDRYFQLLDQIQKLWNGYFIEKALPPFLAKIFGNVFRRNTLKYSDKTTLDVLCSITDNPKLIGVLTAQYGDYGLEPSKSSFYMHAMLANHYMEGAAYPIGGARRFAETIVPVIQGSGGVALSHASVDKILIENNKAAGVRMHDGECFYAKNVVSATGIVNTYSHLLPDEVVKYHGLDKLLCELEPSLAHVGLYVGIKHSVSELNLPKCNYWVFPDEYDHRKSQKKYKDLDSALPVVFISFPSAKDPEAEKNHPNRTSIELISLVPYHWFEKWKDTEWHHRGEEYDALKEKLAEQMLAELFRIAPLLKGKVDFYEVSTPLTTKLFSAHPHGEIYGVAHTPKRFRKKFLRVHTPVKNLFLSGQDVMTASIAGGAMGGLLCASVILKKNLLWTVNRNIH
ncbi:MAG: all-trans-retinol 13,14-reductase [Candidatus Azotimanducaceae bacterium]|jgi:all-trans-retinol 13,14-reductase